MSDDREELITQGQASPGAEDNHEADEPTVLPLAAKPTLTSGPFVLPWTTFSGTKAPSEPYVYIKYEIDEGYNRTEWGSSSSWSYEVRGLALGPHAVNIRYNSPDSETSYPITVVGATVTYPTVLMVVPSSQLIFKGKGNAGATVHVVRATNHWDAFSSAVTVQPNGEWEAPLTDMGLSGKVSVQAQYILTGAPLGYSDAVTLYILGGPAITSPARASQQEQVFTISGGDGIGLAKVEIYEDTQTVKLGEGLVLTEGAWTVPLNLEPGYRALVALQRYNGKVSPRGLSRAFKIRPPKLPTIKVDFPNETTVRLSGDAYNGASADTKVHIHYRNVNPAAWDVSASNGKWEKVITGLLPSNVQYEFDVKQSVTDRSTSGRIYCTEWTDARVDVITPKPTLNTPALNGQIPTFTGRRNVWETNRAGGIQIQLNGQTHTLLPDQQGSVATWSIRATGKIAPGSYTVRARQGINNRWSEFTVLSAQLIIKPDLPVVTKPDSAPVALTTQFVGASWPNADVVVRYKDGAPIHAFKSNPTTGAWSFDATLKSPGRITVQVQATFGGQASGWKDHTFTVNTPIPGITYPQNNDEVGFKLIVRGTNAFPASTIEVFDATVSNKVLGQTTVQTSGDWAVELDKEFEKEGPQVIYAVQKYGTYASERSDPINFIVKVGVPVITTPAANGRFARSSEVVGTGIPAALVTLKIGNRVIASGIEVDALGNWRRTVNLTTVGSTTMVAEQNYKGGMRPSINCMFTVVPNAPVIESPSGSEFVTPAWVVASGAGYPGDTVSVTWGGDEDVIGSFVVDEHGYWSGKLTKTLIGGNPYSLRARSTFNAVASDWSVASVVTLLNVGPILYEPAAGDWVGTQPFYRGLATAGAAITVASCFNPEQVLASTTADANGRWEIQSTQTLPEGTCRVVVRQISGGVVSEWIESARFMVERMARDFTAPTVDYPKPGDSVGRKPVMSGSGVPGAYVQIIKAGVDAELAGGFVDREGHWTASFRAALPVGAFIYSIRQSRDGVLSAYRLPNQAFNVVQVAAGFPGPIITGLQMNETVEVQPLISGTGMPGARVDVHQTNNQQAQASAIVNAQGVWSLRLPVLAVGRYDFGARQFIDGQFSDYCAPISITVTNTISPLVVFSPQNDTQVPSRSLIRGTALPGATVNLRKAGDGNTDYGTGVADAEGHWAIVTHALPVGSFLLTGNATKAGMTTSDWMPERQLWVVNAG